MSQEKKILIIVAHPDDEVLGCGGTIAKYSKLGSQVYVLILGEGATARYSKREEASLKEVGLLRQQAEKAAGILGAKKVFYDNFPDNRFDTVALLDMIKKIEKVKDDIKPDVVFTHHAQDLNIDHQITCKAVVTAFRPLPGKKITELYSFEVQPLKDWGAYKEQPFNPDYFIDISEYIELKLRALKCYTSEVRNYPHPRSQEAIRKLAQYRGLFCIRSYAEAFKTLLRVE